MTARLLPAARVPLASLETSAQQGLLYAVVDSALEDAETKADYLPPDATAVRLLPRAGEDPTGLPWLVALGPAHLAWLRERDPADPWGILVLSDAGLESLAAALGRSLAAVDPDGDEVIVRFFDPRILPDLLRALDATELERWFNRVRAYGRTVPTEIEWLEADGLPVPPPPLPEEPFRLRPEHLQAFAGQQERVVADEVHGFLAAEMPEVVEGMNAKTLEGMIDWGLVSARAYGLTRLADLSTFVALMFDVAPNFHLQPAIHRILTDPARPPERRLHNAIACSKEEDWEAAEAAYDWTGWFPPGQLEADESVSEMAMSGGTDHPATTGDNLDGDAPKFGGADEYADEYEPAEQEDSDD